MNKLIYILTTVLVFEIFVLEMLLEIICIENITIVSVKMFQEKSVYMLLDFCGDRFNVYHCNCAWQHVHYVMQQIPKM